MNQQWLRCVAALFLLVLSVGISSAQTDTSTPVGTWYLNALGQRWNFRFELQNGVYVGGRVDDNGTLTERFDNVSWNSATRTLEFRRNTNGIWQWFRGRIVEGVITARYAASSSVATRPTDPYAYKWKLTGWNFTYLTPGLAPQVYDIELILNSQTNQRARLRIDRSTKSPSGFEGRLKYFAYAENCREELEEDFNIEQWNGTNLRFTVKGVTFVGTVNGRFVKGTQISPVPYQWTGMRAEVLTYGFAGKLPRERERWQARTRKQLEHLALNGNPSPLKQEITIVRGPVSPMLGMPLANRDDNPRTSPQNYNITELKFKHSIANPFGGAAITRESHGYLAKPTTPPRGATRSKTQYPLLIAVNGHGGSAYQTLSPDSIFWYGDGFARQGYMVLAIDVSHRLLKDTIYVHSQNVAHQLGYNPVYLGGDDIVNGNDLRPSIKPEVPPTMTDANLYTDWEEDGERTWDVMRALDYVLSRGDVDPNRVVVAGLSMGGEVAAYLGALDPRIKVSIVSGFSPDLNVLKYRGSHGCWRWHFSEMREYFDFADIFALTAPRPLVIQSGKQDGIYSCLAPAHALEKQVARRVRVAYATDSDKFLHYLHSDSHAFRVGDVSANNAEKWVRVPARIAPTTLGDVSWQTDGTTVAPRQWNLFRYVGDWMGLRFLP